MAGLPHRSRSRRPRWRRILLGVALLAGTGVFMLYAVAGFFASDPYRLYPGTGRAAPLGALYVSGDMGLRFGVAPPVIAALTAHGMTVVGLNAPTVFAHRRTRAETDMIVAAAVANALTRTGTPRIVVVAQSYGADVLQTGLAALPPPLRARIAGIVLIVPGETVYFRADPLGLVYLGAPDSDGAATIAQLGWAPLTCIHGVAEPDSVCPRVVLPGATIVGLPGGHYLDHDSGRVAELVIAALRRVAALPPA